LRALTRRQQRPQYGCANTFQMRPIAPAPEDIRSVSKEDFFDQGMIKSASKAGLNAVVSGRDEVRPWGSVTSVGATIVTHGPANIFVLAIAFDDMRTFVIGEVEQAWSQVIEHLDTCLPIMRPFASWAAQLLEHPGVVSLYERSA
jgi:hypothetical protein